MPALHCGHFLFRRSYTPIIRHGKMQIQCRLQRILIDLQPRQLSRQHIKNGQLTLVIRIGAQFEILTRNIQISTRRERLRKAIFDRRPSVGFVAYDLITKLIVLVLPHCNLLTRNRFRPSSRTPTEYRHIDRKAHRSINCSMPMGVWRAGLPHRTNPRRNLWQVCRARQSNPDQRLIDTQLRGKKITPTIEDLIEHHS